MRDAPSGQAVISASVDRGPTAAGEMVHLLGAAMSDASSSFSMPRVSKRRRPDEPDGCFDDLELLEAMDTQQPAAADPLTREAAFVPPSSAASTACVDALDESFLYDMCATPTTASALRM
jgi:hypothetical protein